MMNKVPCFNDRIQKIDKDSLQSVLNSTQLIISAYSCYMAETTFGFFFCFTDRVQICNSLKNHAGWLKLKRPNALYRNFKNTSNGKLTLLFLLVQNQEEGFNCGAFAVAYVTEVLDGNEKRSNFILKILHKHFDLKLLNDLFSCFAHFYYCLIKY